ncbi:hypothetical protein BS50DRAFT_667208 [Corynespora cassiicola Philippines]|uniref:N-acetyltransferase domain-containing protein n=1 Tax=Corynespora cassiicola Philippines TaxID=1448308 RepID=A0A2T2NNI7_CORCC|nr:hypothetical protein BS50DRAFT_667208 [Corynespora cassiicola Philippines]
MFHLRVATRTDLPQLVALVAEPFSNGSLDTEGLTFSHHEITAYLQWRLPRLLLDKKSLLLVLEFRPVNSFKKVSGRVVGCAILRLGAKISRPSSAEPSYTSLSLLNLRSAVSDLTVWPDTQTAEVHTRFEAAQSFVERSVDQDSTALVFYYLLPDFQGCGVGSKMLAEVREKAEQLDTRVPFSALFRSEDVSFGEISGLKHVKDAGKLRVLEPTC